MNLTKYFIQPNISKILPLISACNQHKNYYWAFSLFWPSLQNSVYLQHISIQTSHISSAQEPGGYIIILDSIDL